MGKAKYTSTRTADYFRAGDQDTLRRLCTYFRACHEQRENGFLNLVSGSMVVAVAEFLEKSVIPKLDEAQVKGELRRPV
jgi:hypothetical protein